MGIREQIIEIARVRIRDGLGTRHQTRPTTYYRGMVEIDGKGYEVLVSWPDGAAEHEVKAVWVEDKR